eukprot:351361-Pleurochrysis_carterae.AAC.1
MQGARKHQRAQYVGAALQRLRSMQSSHRRGWQRTNIATKDWLSAPPLYSRRCEPAQTAKQELRQSFMKTDNVAYSPSPAPTF